MLKERLVVAGDAEPSPEKRVVDEGEVRDGVGGADGGLAPLMCVGRNPSAIVPSRASSSSSTPLSTDTLTDSLVDLLRSNSPALLSLSSMPKTVWTSKRKCWWMSEKIIVASRQRFNGGRRLLPESLKGFGFPLRRLVTGL